MVFFPYLAEKAESQFSLSAPGSVRGKRQKKKKKNVAFSPNTGSYSIPFPGGSHGFEGTVLLHLIPLLMPFGVSLLLHHVPTFFASLQGTVWARPVEERSFFLDKDFAVAPKVA